VKTASRPETFGRLFGLSRVAQTHNLVRRRLDDQLIVREAKGVMLLGEANREAHSTR
jgi:hypothetical protein